jgi:hypothetical protein
MTGTVETKLREHFGTPVRLVLDVDDDAGPSGGAANSGSTTGSGGGPGASPSAASASASASAPDPAPAGGDPRAYGPEDDYDPAAFAAPAADPDDQAKEAEARLLQAFPGASEVAG